MWMGRRSVGLLVGVGIALGFAPDAASSCEWLPPSDVLVLPSDGAEEVPIDARIWVAGGGGSEVVVVHEGEEIGGTKHGSGWWSFGLGEMFPYSTYEFVVNICFAAGCPIVYEYGPFAFTTSAEEASLPAEVSVVAVVMGAPGSDALQGAVPASCEEQVLDQDCFDEVPVLIAGFAVEPNLSAAVFSAWPVGADDSEMLLSSAECPILFAGPSADISGSCFWLVAYSLAGEASQPAKACLDGGAEAETSGLADNMNDARSSQAEDKWSGPVDATGYGSGAGRGCSTALCVHSEARLGCVGVLVVLLLVGAVVCRSSSPSVRSCGGAPARS